MNDNNGWPDRLLLLAAPMIAVAWLWAFLLSPEFRSVHSLADILPIVRMAALIALAWFAVRWARSGELGRRFDRAREGMPHLWGASILMAACAFPLVLCALGKYYWVHIGAIVLIYIILSIGLNIVVGFSGLLVLGFTAFYGIGAYMTAILMLHFSQWTYLIWALIPLAALLAAVFGLILGAPTLRLRGDYLAIVTMGFGEIVRIVLTNWDSLTQGPKGISVTAPFVLAGWDLSKSVQIGPVRLDSDTQYYYLMLVFTALIALMVHRLNQSRIGRAWVAMREDELAAKCFGIDVTRYKLLAFALAAACAGVAGVFFASLQRFVDPMSFTFLESVLILCIVVLGGMGSLSGCVFAAIILQVLPEKLQMLEEYRMLIFGLLMILMMILRPQGLIPSKRRLRELKRRVA